LNNRSDFSFIAECIFFSAYINVCRVLATRYPFCRVNRKVPPADCRGNVGDYGENHLSGTWANVLPAKCGRNDACRLVGKCASSRVKEPHPSCRVRVKCTSPAERDGSSLPQSEDSTYLTCRVR
jgi:hypothetical protein